LCHVYTCPLVFWNAKYAICDKDPGQKTTRADNVWPLVWECAGNSEIELMPNQLPKRRNKTC
jgi:hypothetical protein